MAGCVLGTVSQGASGAGTGHAGAVRTIVDCDAARDCPPMVVAPASAPGATVGSDPAEADRQGDEARHAVALKSFAIGAREVTVREYGACVAASACRAPEWREEGGEANAASGASSYYRSLGAAITESDRPVVGVSWDDAAAYAAWLSSATGKRYRLPSETEWEYAARAGSSGAFWWGEEVAPDGHGMANCSGCGSAFDRKGGAPAGSFQPNPWGVADASGNVWEWTADAYCPDFERSPADGAARTHSSCAGAGDLKVLRGGSSFSPPAQVRLSVRLRNHHDFRSSSVGFRVARSLDE